MELTSRDEPVSFGVDSGQLAVIGNVWNDPKAFLSFLTGFQEGDGSERVRTDLVMKSTNKCYTFNKAFTNYDHVIPGLGKTANQLLASDEAELIQRDGPLIQTARTYTGFSRLGLRRSGFGLARLDEDSGFPYALITSMAYGDGCYDGIFAKAGKAGYDFILNSFCDDEEVRIVDVGRMKTWGLVAITDPCYLINYQEPVFMQVECDSYGLTPVRAIIGRDGRHDLCGGFIIPFA